MVFKPEDEPDQGGIYDHNPEAWRQHTPLNDAENEAGDSSATPDEKSFDGNQLKNQEAASQDGDPAATPSFSFRNDDSGGSGFAQKVRGKLAEKTKSKTGKAVGLGVGAGSGMAVLAGIIILMIFLSSLKVINFGEVMAVAGYARFNGIMQERTTQDIFDASVVSGEGSIEISKGTLVDRILLRNVDGQIAELGRQGKLKFLMEGDQLKGVKIRGETITVDGVAQELGHGDTYEAASRAAKKAIRQEFVDRVQVSVGEGLALEPRYVRGGIFKTIANGTGFKFERWPNGGKNLDGKTATEANVQDQLDSTKEISGDKLIETGVSQIDLTSKQLKNADKLKAYLEKNGGEFDMAKFAELAQADVAKSVGIQETVSKVSIGVLVISLACMANQAFAHAGQAQENNEYEAMRMGLQLLAARDKIKQGASSVAVSVAAHQVDGGDRAPAYQNAIHKAVVAQGVDDPKLKPQGQDTADLIAKLTSPSRLSFGIAGGIAGAFPGGDAALKKLDATFCDQVLSPQGALTIAGIEILAQAAIGILTSGSGVVADEAGGRVAASIIVKALADATFNTVKDTISVKSFAVLGGTAIYALGLKFVAGSLASTNFSGAETGPGYVQRGFVGTNILQSYQERTVGGMPISNTDAASADKHYGLLNQQEWQHQNTFARYFSPENPYSITGTVAMAIPSSFASGLTSLRTSIANFGNILHPLAIGGLIQSIIPGLNQHAAAAAGYDPYNGVQQWGFTAAEMDKMRNDDTYSITENEKHLSASEKTAFDATIGPCFDAARSQYQVNNDPACTAEKLGTEKAFRYRLIKLDTYIADSAQDDFSHTSVTSGGSSNEISSGTFTWPMTAQSTITQCFTGATGHPGIDIAGVDGTPIYAIADGVVDDNPKSVDGYGTHFVSITHANGLGSSYGHMKTATVTKGQKVKKGDQIGTQGNEDQRHVSSGSHLHLNVFPGTYSGSDTPNLDPLANGLAIPAGVTNNKNCH